MRVFAHYSGDTLLIEGYKTPGFDIHASVAAELGIERKYAKAVNFLIIYGGGAAKLASNVGCSDEKARAFLEKYYSRLPGVKALRNQAKRFIETRVIRDPADTSKVIKWGYVKDLFGRPYHLPSDKSYRAVNRLVAGCAANLMKHGMARVFGLIEAIRKEHGPDAACLLINIHDEIEIEIRRDVPAESVWVPRITTAMEDFPQFKVPIRCEVKMTETTWNEAKPWYS
jgi:DNA polymerase-1